MSATLPATANTDQTRPQPRAFYPALDGLRSIAFLMVFFQHYASMPWGWTGVNIFFVLSGFLITGILYDTRDAPHRARNFYIRRTLRIFPLYYAVFLGLLVLHPLLHWHWSLLWLAWPLYLGNFLRFLSPATTDIGTPQELAADAHLSSDRLPRSELYLGHFWSLCVEEQFYLLWPWVVFWLRSRRALLWICASTVVLVPLARLITQRLAPPWMLDNELLYRATPFQLDALLLGGLIALLWRGSHRDTLSKLARFLTPALLLAAAIYLAFTIHPGVPYDYPDWNFTWGLTFINVLSASVILTCLQPAGWLPRLLQWSPMRWLGRISYGAYVLHDIPHGLYVHFVTSLSAHSHFVANHYDNCIRTLALTGTLLLAWLSFRFLETPFLSLKEKWTSSHPHKAATKPGPQPTST